MTQLFTLLALLLPGGAGGDNAACQEIYESLRQIYEVYPGKQFFLHYSVQEIRSGTESERVSYRIWFDGTRTRTEGIGMLILTDENNSVMIDSKAKKIIISKSGLSLFNAESFKLISWDSLKKIGSRVVCEETPKRTISIRYSDEWTRKSGIREVVATISKDGKNLLGSTYRTSDRTLHYEYHKYSRELLDISLPADVLQSVYIGGSVRPDFKDFQLLDLRISGASK